MEGHEDMNSIVVKVLSVSLMGIEQIMLFILANSLFEKKRSTFSTAVSLIIITLISFPVVNSLGNISFIKFFVALILLVFWMNYCYHAKTVSYIFTVLFFLGYLMLADGVFLSLSGILMHKSLQEITENPYAYFLLSFSAKTAELLIVLLISIWAKQHFHKQWSSWVNWIRTLFLPASSLVVSIFLPRMYSISPELGQELLLCSAVLLLGDIASIFLLNYLEDQQVAIQDNAILRQNMKTQLDNIEAWREAYAGQRKQTHDFQNQLLVIHGMIEKSVSKKELLDYIESVQSVLLPTATFVNTRRTATDIVLNQKFYIAKSKNISFETQLDDLSAIRMPDDALITVLANLIDNALEACEKIADPGQRYIFLKIKIEDGVTLLHIRNKTASPVIIQNNRIITTKPNPRSHGYGLQNVISVLNRYNAIYSLKYSPEDSFFSFTAQIDP